MPMPTPMSGDEADERRGPDVELIRPEDFLASDRFPADARRMGVDRWSDEAAMIAFAASLDSTKPSHKLIAWVLLFAFVAPLVLTLWYELT